MQQYRLGVDMVYSPAQLQLLSIWGGGGRHWAVVFILCMFMHPMVGSREQCV